MKRYEIIWATIFVAILVIIGIYYEDSMFGIFTTITGVLCVVFAAKGSKYTYLFGIINTACYGYIAYFANYGGDFVLNIFYYFPMQFVGIYMWSKHYLTSGYIQGRSFKTRDYLISIVILFIGTIFMMWMMPIINSFFAMDSNPLPVIDSFTTFASVYAMILMVRRFNEQWHLWIVINILSIGMWLKLNDPAMVVMWCAYLINSIYGVYSWNKLQRN